MSEFTEYIGYAAMLTLMVSFLLKDIKKLRSLNTIACLLFVWYGFLLPSYPIVISNAFIAVINIYYLFIKKNN